MGPWTLCLGCPVDSLRKPTIRSLGMQPQTPPPRPEGRGRETRRVLVPGCPLRVGFGVGMGTVGAECQLRAC